MSAILVLSSYGIGDQVGVRYPPVDAFTHELRQQLAAPGADVVVHHARTLQAHDSYLRGLRSAPALIYACGASVMAVALRWLGERGALDVPVIYWGSHIVDCGQPVNRPPGHPAVRCIDLPMPLYQSHRQFRLLRLLFPRLEQVHCAFSMDSAFVTAWRRERYLQASAAGTPWIRAGSSLSAFPGLASLGEIVDVEVFEHPCSDGESAARAVAQVPRSPARSRDQVRACMISCIDCLHIEGAIERMVATAAAAQVPFVGLNFGGFLADGPVLSVESDMSGAGRIAARMAARALRGEPAPAGERVVRHDTMVFRENPAAMAAWGIALSADERVQIRRVCEQILS